MGGADGVVGIPDFLMIREQAMQELMSEVALILVLLAVVIISGRL